VNRLPFILLVASFLAGCSPTLSPLYRDYEVREPGLAAVDEGSVDVGDANASNASNASNVDTVPADESFVDDAELLDRIRLGLENAGWTVIDSITDNVVTAESRQFREWGIYSIEVELEVAPVGGDYVRLMIHPFRKFFTGKRRKIGYLRGSLARVVLKDLHASFEEEGLHNIGFMQSRDREALRGK